MIICKIIDNYFYLALLVSILLISKRCILKTQINLDTIQETLLIPLLGRAKEFEVGKPIVIDSKSVEIVNLLNYDFERLSNAKNSLVCSCLQGMIIDNWVGNFLKLYPHGTVVEIVVGLNARFERLDNVKMCCFELDLSDVIDLLLQFFTEKSCRSFTSGSVIDNDWIKRIKETITPPYMFVAYGLLMYLSKQQVTQLFDKLTENFSDSQFAFGCISPLMLKIKSVPSNICQQILTGVFRISARFKIGTPVFECWKLLPSQILKLKESERLSLSWIKRLLFKYFPPFRNSYRLALLHIA